MVKKSKSFRIGESLGEPIEAIDRRWATAPTAGPAQVVRTLRARSGRTLQELAAKTGLSASTISKIEAGVISPGYETIVALAEGLGVEPAEFFKPAVDSVPVGRRGVTRAGEGVEHASAHYTYKVQAADLLRKDFLPLVVTIRSRSVEEFDELPAHRGEEFVYVISGEVHLFTSQYEPLVLREGDSVYFNSAGGHALVSVGEHDAKVVWVCSQIGAGELADKGAQA